MKNHIKKYTNVLNKKICNEIIKNCLDSEWEKAKITDDSVSSDRNCYIKKLHPDYENIIHRCIGHRLWTFII